MLLSKEIRQLKAEIKKMPKGRLHCYSDGKWFVAEESNPKKRKYIPKSKRDFAEQLALKQYKEARLKDAYKEKNAVEQFLSNYPQEKHTDSFYAKSEGHRELLSKFYAPAFDTKIQWLLSLPTSNEHPQTLKIITPAGHYVRSKSELIIAQRLHSHNIAYKYEGEFHVGDIILHPDFLVIHPITGELFIWEHFGLADDQAYSRNIELKLRTYRENGYYPSINLITTYETKEHPLDYNLVDSLINHYFL